MSRLKVAGLVLAGLVLVGGIFSAARWYYGGKVRDAAIARDRALEAADSLRLVAQSKDSLATLWEIRARPALSENEILESANALLREHLEATGRRIRALTRAVAELDVEVETAGTATTARDTTTIEFAERDSVFSIEGAVAFPGRIEPDPSPEIAVRAAVSASLAFDLGLSCDPETGAPFAEALSTDPRLRFSDVRTIVDPDVGCYPDVSLDLFSANLIPRIEPATGIVYGLGIITGVVLSK